METLCTMKLLEIKHFLPEVFYNVLSSEISELRPSQEKAVKKGLLRGKNLLVCTPTASGKTLVAELAGVKNVLEGKGKLVYIVPLRALASEKYNDFSARYGVICSIAMSSGDIDSDDRYLSDYDVIITTSEKLDSLLRHHTPWITQVGTIIVDEVHLINDSSRGPTLEIVITLLRQIVRAQIIALSATVGNAPELAAWLDAELVEDDWRPVELRKGVYVDGKTTFY